MNSWCGHTSVPSQLDLYYCQMSQIPKNPRVAQSRPYHLPPNKSRLSPVAYLPGNYLFVRSEIVSTFPIGPAYFSSLSNSRRHFVIEARSLFDWRYSSIDSVATLLLWSHSLPASTSISQTPHNVLKIISTSVMCRPLLISAGSHPLFCRCQAFAARSYF